jgi:hypothetical protein
LKKEWIISVWETFPLFESRVKYAAYDAFVLIDLFLKMKDSMENNYKGTNIYKSLSEDDEFKLEPESNVGKRDSS